MPVLRQGFALWRWVRRVFSRRNLTVRLLGLSVSEGTANEPGLILLQIDGFAFQQLQKAIDEGRMPFVRRLFKREKYEAFPMYSGQPATTPAVLAELFYGVPQAVPSFSFRDHRSGQVVEMLQPEIAATIQSELEARGDGLLKNGSAYCDIYSGGAAESQFCPANMTWEAMSEASSWRKAAIALLNFPALLRIILQTLAECGISIAQILKSRLGRRELSYELTFLPRRIIGHVLIRELTAIAAEVDATRGLPVMHANLLGYDELAHRRGPDSRFAHQGLRDIDRVVQRIWMAAMASKRRDYHVWLMADHGQERTAIYDKVCGRNIVDAVKSLFQELLPSGGSAAHGADADPDAAEPVVTAIGPLGYIYWSGPLRPTDVERIALRISMDLHVPIVMAKLPQGPTAWVAGKQLRLPDEAVEFLGADHPFLNEVAEDFTNLCDHPDAGRFVICGYRREGESLSFVAEHGAHGGPGPQETSGFVVLPPEDRHRAPDFIRPMVLREMAQSLLSSHRVRSSRSVASRRSELRIVTYNVHSCIGLDGRLSPQRIARVLASLDADVIALQELDVGRQRSGGVDQAQLIAEELAMDCQFFPCLEIASEKYGNAVLSRLPMDVVSSGRLPAAVAGTEPRGALWVRLEHDSRVVNLLTTHLGLHPRDRSQQVDALLGEDWLALAEGPIVVCGDFNAGPRSAVFRKLCRVYRDAFTVGGHTPQRTWFSPLPLARIDHVFVSRDISVPHIRTADGALARVASDHLPLVADLILEPAAAHTRRTTAQTAGVAPR